MTTLAVNAKNRAVAQLLDYPFNSYANLGGVFFGASSSGLHRVFYGGANVAEEIDAALRTVSTDLGITEPKRMWMLYIGYESDGDLQVTARANETTVGTYTIPGNGTGQQRATVKLGQGAYGRYWDFEFSNVDGADFSIDSVEVVPIILNHGRG